MYSVSMLGAFALWVDGRHVQLPGAAERVVAFLALQDRPVIRHRVAGVLWPDVSEERSLGSLRSALWRMRQLSGRSVVVGDVQLQLPAGTQRDTDLLCDQSHRLVAQGELDVDTIDASQFGSELLPGWYDDWLIFERERLRQLSLQGLEALSRRQSTSGRHAEAVDSAWRAISLEPLRESSHARLVDAHLAEGNLCDALRRYRAFADLLDTELGIEPGADLRARIDAAMLGRTPGVQTSRRSGASRAGARDEAFEPGSDKLSRVVGLRHHPAGAIGRAVQLGGGDAGAQFVPLEPGRDDQDARILTDARAVIGVVEHASSVTVPGHPAVNDASTRRDRGGAPAQATR